MSTALGCAVAALIVWAAAASRSDSRVRRLVPERRSDERTAGVLTSAGVLVWRAAVRMVPSLRGRAIDDGAARSLAASALVVAGALIVSPVMAAALAAALLARIPLRARTATTRRQSAIRRELPMVIDLYRLAVGAGLNVTMATAAVAARLDGPLAAELSTVMGDVARGRRLGDALDDVPRRTVDDVRPLVSALTSSERYGSSLSVVLERLAHESRVDQERRADRAAQRLSVQLLFPVAGCTLPAFALLTVAPLLAGGFGPLASSFH